MQVETAAVRRCRTAAVQATSVQRSRGRTRGRGRRTRQRPVAETRTRGLAVSRSRATPAAVYGLADSRDADAGCGPTAADEGLRGEGSYFRQYILGFLSWAFSGLHIRGPDGVSTGEK